MSSLISDEYPYDLKSESLTPLPRDVFEETWNTDLSAIEAEIEQLQDGEPCDTPSPNLNALVRAEKCSCIFCIHHIPVACRQPLPDHLPRIENRHEPASCTCGQCGNGLVMIREDITEQLDVEPAKFFVHRHIRPRHGRRGSTDLGDDE